MTIRIKHSKYNASVPFYTSVLSVIFSAMLSAIPSAFAGEPIASNQPLCPPMVAPMPTYRTADNKTVKPIKMPVTQEEHLLHKQQIHSPDVDIRRFAIASLAMAGDSDLLPGLIKRGDEHGLGTYIFYYRNEDKTKCLAPEVEEVISNYLRTPGTGMKFLRLLRYNLYQSPQLRKQLLALVADPPVSYQRHLHFIRALLATNLPIPAIDMLPHVKNYIDYYKAKYGHYSQLPPFNELKSYLDFISRFKDEKSIAFFHSLVSKPDPENWKEREHQIIMGLRMYLFRHAEKYPTAMTNKFLLSELKHLSSVKEGINLSYNEIRSLFEALLANNVDGALNSRMIATIDYLLKDTRGMSASDTQTHLLRYDIYKMLARINTTKAYNRLILELAALKKFTETNEVDFFRIIDLGNKIDNHIEVDLYPLLAANPFPNNIMKNDGIVRILIKHPHPKARAYLTNLLGKLGMIEMYNVRARPTYFANILKALSAYDSEIMYEQTKREIDSLYQEGKLTKKEFDSLYVPFSNEEVAVIAANKPLLDGVKRIFNYLILPIENNSVRLKYGKTDKLSDYYKLANNQEFYLITVHQFLLGRMMVNRKTGESISLCGKAIISPDKRHLVCTQQDIDAGEYGNVIVVYTITDQGIEVEWKHGYTPDSRTGPRNAKWKGNHTIVFEENFYENNKFMMRPVQLQYLDGHWIKRSVE